MNQASDFAPFIYFTQALRRGAGDELLSPVQRSCWLLWFQIDGVTELTDGVGRWHLQGRQVLLAQPGVAATWSAPAHILRMAFDPVHRGHRRSAKGSYVPRSKRPQADAETLFGYPLSPLVPEPFATEAQALVREADARIYADMLSRHEMGLRLGLWLLRYARSQAPSREEPIIEARGLVTRAEDLMRHGVDKRHTVAGIAAMLGLSRGHFIRVYTQARGYGPGAFIGRQRLLSAQAQLRNTSATVDAIARRVGFGSARGLHQAFVREFGVSPGAWRQAQHRE